MNKDFRHSRVNRTSPFTVWREDIQRRLANAGRRLSHRRDRREGKREIMEVVCQ